MTTETYDEMGGGRQDPLISAFGTEVLEGALETAEIFGLQRDYEPNPDVKQKTLRNGKAIELPSGLMYSELHTMSNGREYQVLNGIPFRKETDVPTVIGTALGTDVLGHNMRTANKVMALGSHVVMIGAEGGYPQVPKSPSDVRAYLGNLAKISMRESARNVHEILEVNDLKDLYLPGTAAVIGESRFAGIAMGVTAEAGRFERAIVYTDAIAPPFPVPKPIEFRRDNVGENVGRLCEIAQQVGSLTVHASKLGLKRLRHYPRTVNLNPLFLAHVVATIPTLVNGTAGQMAKEISGEAKIHADHFESDPWSNPAGWMNILNPDDYPHAVNEVHPGDHGAILKPHIQAARLIRLAGLIDQLAVNNDRVEDIDWTKVHMTGRLAASGVKR